jgi:hypothetical protein
MGRQQLVSVQMRWKALSVPQWQKTPRESLGERAGPKLMVVVWSTRV